MRLCDNWTRQCTECLSIAWVNEHTKKMRKTKFKAKLQAFFNSKNLFCISKFPVLYIKISLPCLPLFQGVAIQGPNSIEKKSTKKPLEIPF